MGTNGTRLTPGQGWVLALTSAVSLMVSLDIQVVATALPVIRSHLHASLTALEWTVNAYTLSFAVLLLTGAALGERLGRRRMLAAGVGLFTAASAGCALAPDAGGARRGSGRPGRGCGADAPAGAGPAVRGVPAAAPGLGAGIFSSVTGIAVLAGPVVGGAVAQGLTWPWIFWLNVPIGLIMIPLVLIKVQPTAERGGQPRSVGLILATGGALGIVWALIRANSTGWASPEIAATLATGIVLAVAFVAWELRAVDPMVPLRLFRSRAFAAGNATAFCVFAVLLAMVFFMAQFLETGLGYGPLGAGLRLLPGWATLTVIAPFTGALISRLGERPLMAGGLTVVAGALTWIALLARDAGSSLPYSHMVAPLLLAGCGASVAIPATMSAVMTSVPPAAIGQASGILNTLRQPAESSASRSAPPSSPPAATMPRPRPSPDGFAAAMVACAGLALLGAASGLVIPGRRQPTPATPSSRVHNDAPKIETRR